jgi:serine/threonine protein kinase
MTVSTVGRYRVEQELTRGGMGVIFLANDPFMQRQVVIKVLLNQRADDDIFREFFQHEAEIIAALEHPYIVPVYDFGWHGDRPYIVMRYMSGGTLEDRLTQGGVKMAGIVQIFSRVGEALDAAHALNIIHRDIKPSNILFDGKNEAFLADFGIAKSMTLTDEAGTWLVGTPAYMSPEQVDDGKIDGRADVYSLGVVLYRLLTGELPFKAESTTGFLEAQKNSPVPDIHLLRSDISPIWQEIVGKALAKDPDDRYSSAGEFARDVRDMVSGRWYLRKL